MNKSRSFLPNGHQQQLFVIVVLPLGVGVVIYELSHLFFPLRMEIGRENLQPDKDDGCA